VTATFLLDTHTLLWALYDPSQLPYNVREQIENASAKIYASSVSAFEVALKFGRGNLDFAESLATGFLKEIAVPGFLPISLSPAHAQCAGLLSITHKDPFDRMLIAQAQIEQMTLISNEKIFDQFGVIRLW
jgi:PIN domain nuclease of toxin-antitoxin system